MSTQPFLREAGEPAQQKNFLCGPFWAARILHDAGFHEFDQEPVDEDQLARDAGTILPDREDGSVPPGATSLSGYRFDLPRAPTAVAGTGAGALAAALERVAEGTLRCVPLRGPWRAETIEAVQEGVANGLSGVRLLANVQTGRFWGSHPSAEELLAEFSGKPVEGPPADWDVGHFCELELLLRGPGGSLVVVHDSYPTLGWNGRHLQPPRAVAAALERDDGNEGGILAVAPVAVAGEVEELAHRLGVEIGIWDNGTRGEQ
jgi:hypothetical protein